MTRKAATTTKTFFLIPLLWSAAVTLWSLSSTSKLWNDPAGLASAPDDAPPVGRRDARPTSVVDDGAPSSRRSLANGATSKAYPGAFGPRYDEVPELKRPPRSHPMTTAYQDSTVVTRAPWFVPKEICTGGCCATTVAVSLDQDDTRVKNTVDGLDLADVLVRGHQMNAFHVFLASVLSPELIPCLQPGTIIHSDSYGGTLARFFAEYRPKITVPYLLISSETDTAMPHREHIERLETDDLLIHWYGNNPRFRGPVKPVYRKKFTGFMLGLSKYHPQMPHMAHYLRATNYTNPFAGEVNKRRWTESAELANAADTTPVLFVKFGINPASQHRKTPMAMACEGRTTEPKDNVTCTTKDVTFSMHETYAAASKYLFGLSPPGAGMDCYRTYELLLLGVIPVVKYEEEYQHLFRGLPIVQLESWNLSQEELLKRMRDYVASDEFRKNDFDGWERLFLRYWRRKMLAQTGRDGDIVKDDQGREYYQAWHYSLYQKPLVTNKWPLPKTET